MLQAVECVAADVAHNAVGQPVVAGTGKELGSGSQSDQNANADQQGNHGGEIDPSLTDQQIDDLTG